MFKKSLWLLIFLLIHFLTLFCLDYTTEFVFKIKTNGISELPEVNFQEISNYQLKTAEEAKISRFYFYQSHTEKLYNVSVKKDNDVNTFFKRGFEYIQDDDIFQTDSKRIGSICLLKMQSTQKLVLSAINPIMIQE